MNFRFVTFLTIITISLSVGGLAQSTSTKSKTGGKRVNETTTKPTKTAKVVKTDALSAPESSTGSKSIIASTPDGVKVVLHPNMTWEFWSEPKKEVSIFDSNLKSYPVGDVIDALNTINFSKSEFETTEEHAARVNRDFSNLKLKGDPRKVSDMAFVFDRQWNGPSFPEIQNANNYTAETQEFSFAVGWALSKLMLDGKSNVVRYSDFSKYPTLYELAIGSLANGTAIAGGGKCVANANSAESYDFTFFVDREQAKKIAEYLRIAVFATPKCVEATPNGEKGPSLTKLYVGVNRIVVFDQRNGKVYYDAVSNTAEK
ncbi:MAG: hypothetical protein ACK5NT_14770 [Pyrinomonadaceae bacterium]